MSRLREERTAGKDVEKGGFYSGSAVDTSARRGEGKRTPRAVEEPERDRERSGTRVGPESGPGPTGTVPVAAPGRGGHREAPGGYRGVTGGHGRAPEGTGGLPGGYRECTGSAPGGTGEVPGGTWRYWGGTGRAPEGTERYRRDTGGVPGGTGRAPEATGEVPGVHWRAPGFTGRAPGGTWRVPGGTGRYLESTGRAPGGYREGTRVHWPHPGAPRDPRSLPPPLCSCSEGSEVPAQGSGQAVTPVLPPPSPSPRRCRR